MLDKNYQGPLDNIASLQAAFESYTQGQEGIDRLRFQQSSLQQLLDTTVLLEKEHKAKFRSCFNVSARLKSLVAFVERYASAVDFLVQTGSGLALNPAALVWGLLRALLEVSSLAWRTGIPTRELTIRKLASSATKYFSSLLDLLEQLGFTVSLYGEYLEMLQHSRFQVALGNVFLDITGILAKGRMMFTRNRKSTRPSIYDGGH